MPDDHSKELDADLLKGIEGLRDDDTVDFDSEQKQDDGWVKFYNECPECKTPMARTTLQAENKPDTPGPGTREKIHIHCVCPDCGEYETVYSIYKHTKPYGVDHE